MQLEAQYQMSRYSLMAGDTLVSLHGRLLCNSAYYTLADTAAIFSNSEEVRRQYLALGLIHEAVRTYPTPITVAVENEQYQRARKMMNEYEQLSGLFAADGFFTDTTRAQYHSFKGHYYLGIHEIDSAELQFRHIMPNRPLAIDAYRGLIAVYREKGNNDSVQKYSILFEKQAVELLQHTRQMAIAQTKGMYDYSRQEKIAQEQSVKAQQRGYIIIGTLVLMLVLAILFAKTRKRRKLQLIQTTNAYLQTQKEIASIQEELTFLRNHCQNLEGAQVLLKSKEAQMQQMEDMLERYKERLGYPICENDQEALNNAEIVQHLHEICQMQSSKENGILKVVSPRACEEAEWQELFAAIKKYHYSFYHRITTVTHLPKLQYKVCVLTRLGFTPTEMAILLDTTIQNISNARSKLVRRLFNSSETTLL